MSTYDWRSALIKVCASGHHARIRKSKFAQEDTASARLRKSIRKNKKGLLASPRPNPPTTPSLPHLVRPPLPDLDSPWPDLDPPLLNFDLGRALASSRHIWTLDLGWRRTSCLLARHCRALSHRAAWPPPSRRHGPVTEVRLLTGRAHGRQSQKEREGCAVRERERGVLFRVCIFLYILEMVVGYCGLAVWV